MESNTEEDRNSEEVRDRVAFIFENYGLEELLEMNDLTPEDVIYMLYMAGQIREPEAYFP